MEDFQALFSDFLARRGMKFTEPRRQILEAVFALHEHFNAEQLYDKVRKLSAEVSLATVYRTLPLLVEAGLIQLSLHFSSRDVYEHIFGHPRHVHWVCSNCGSVQETELDSFSQALAETAARLQFHTVEISVQVHGLCWKCRQNENEFH